MTDSTIQLIHEVKELEKQLKETWEEMYLDMITTVVKSRAKQARKASSEFGRLARLWRIKSILLNNLPQSETKDAYAQYKQQKTA
jgi:phage regulator Rha-like protein